MATEISVKANVPDSANLTMTTEYLVVNGKHYQVRNGYLYRQVKPSAFPIKNILSMEYLAIRSKRLLIIFILLMSLIVFGGAGIGKMLSATKQVDRKVQKIEMVYNYLADKDSDLNITDTEKNDFSKVGLAGGVVIYIGLIIGSVFCLFCYLFRPYRVLYISAIGATIAVEKKFYDKQGLDSLIIRWKRGNTNVL